MAAVSSMSDNQIPRPTQTQWDFDLVEQSHVPISQPIRTSQQPAIPTPAPYYMPPQPYQYTYGVGPQPPYPYASQYYPTAPPPNGYAPYPVMYNNHSSSSMSPNGGASHGGLSPRALPRPPYGSTLSYMAPPAPKTLGSPILPGRPLPPPQTYGYPMASASYYDERYSYGGLARPITNSAGLLPPPQQQHQQQHQNAFPTPAATPPLSPSQISRFNNTLEPRNSNNTGWPSSSIPPIASNLSPWTPSSDCNPRHQTILPPVITIPLPQERSHTNSITSLNGFTTPHSAPSEGSQPYNDDLQHPIMRRSSLDGVAHAGLMRRSSLDGMAQSGSMMRRSSIDGMLHPEMMRRSSIDALNHPAMMRRESIDSNSTSLDAATIQQYPPPPQPHPHQQHHQPVTLPSLMTQIPQKQQQQELNSEPLKPRLGRPSLAQRFGLPSDSRKPGVKSSSSSSNNSVPPTSEVDISGDGEATTGASTPLSERKCFKCPVANCDKSFTRQYNLKAHVRAHSGERPFACDHCHAAFPRSHDLRRHLQSRHEEARRHRCDHCGVTFARSDALRRHLKAATAKINARIAAGEDIPDHVIQSLRPSPRNSNDSGYKKTGGRRRRAVGGSEGDGDEDGSNADASGGSRRSSLKRRASATRNSSKRRKAKEDDDEEEEDDDEDEEITDDEDGEGQEEEDEDEVEHEVVAAPDKTGRKTGESTGDEEEVSPDSDDGEFVPGRQNSGVGTTDRHVSSTTTGRQSARRRRDKKDQ
ncbi:hypothetical protein SmJEL517_g02147 [Synchytrium microbalum]|uniref:C2H2-type domain-containing protein n=1 Tax=Synchytrium microbalum TaxID=1806994 RepID=A0A507C7Q3_9FUNG|nr:uncharacterized protein SmJEL517_g02147 [Synchytrium microbalum]TPX35531.1 hypothetical protein SmJEL517_g02147 [Synchytrium microbalum]